MNEYKSNSHKSKEAQNNAQTSEKKIEKVVTGSAKPKKKNEIQKFADVFISEDVGNVKSYIVWDVLVPAFKKAIYDIVTNGIDMILYGESGRTKKNSTASKVSYRSYYEKENDRRDYPTRKIKTGYDYDNIVFESRGDAEAVLEAMIDIIDQYGVVSVGDLYDLADMSVDNYTLNKYGWTDIRNASVNRVRDGYMLKLPKALPLN